MVRRDNKFRKKILSLLKSSESPLKLEDFIAAFRSRTKTTSRIQDSLQYELQSLVQANYIYLNKQQQYQLAPDVKARQTLFRGKVIKNMKGFAFIVTQDPPPELKEDVFVDVNEAKNLISGDIVEFSVVAARHTLKKVSAKIHRIIERGVEQLVGRFILAADGPSVEICSKDINTIIPLEETKEFTNISPGSAVLVEIKNNKKANSLRGKVISVLADRLNGKTDDQFVFSKKNIAYEFPKEVIEEAKKFPDQISKQDKKGRKDLTDIPFITIDGEDAKDFDDAICTKINPKGNIKLWVAIADVAHYVKPGTEIQKEAEKRATSIYFPHRVLPMLPEKLSNGLCSLNPNVERLCMVAELEFNNKGKRVKQKFYEAFFRSHRRCTYQEIQNYIKGKPLKKASKKVLNNIENSYTLYKKLYKFRRNRGSVDLDLKEKKIFVDTNGEVEKIETILRKDSNKLIEEFMIAANEAVAEFIISHNYPSLFRVHEEPKIDAVNSFQSVAKTLGVHIHFNPTNISPKDYQTFLKNIAGHPAQRTLNFLLLRSMKQAYYCEENLKHFGLASTCYTHFTSPIRRYPDLVIHRTLKAIFRKQKKSKIEQLAQIGQHCSQRERIAVDAEREMSRIKEVRYAEQFTGDKFAATIIGITKNGLFLELDKLLIEGFVPKESLQERYHFNETQMCLEPHRVGKKIRIGDQAEVEIISTSPHQLRIELKAIKIGSLKISSSNSKEKKERFRKKLRSKSTKKVTKPKSKSKSKAQITSSSKQTKKTTKKSKRSRPRNRSKSKRK